MSKRGWPVANLLSLLLTALIFTGCATELTFRTQRPPVWNTLGIQRIAIMPFTAPANTAAQSYAAILLANEARSRIQAANRFTLVSSQEIQRQRTAGGNIENLADALFEGQVISLSVRDSSEQYSYKNKEGKTITYTVYRRDAGLSFNFTLTRTRDAAEIGSETISLENYSSDEDPWKLAPAEDLIQGMVQNYMAGIARYVAPYMATERRRLEPETSRDKAIKQRAKDAAAQVKEGNYRIAREAFLGIYRDSGSFAAAYNAGLLLELQGDAEGAALLMQRVYSETGNPRAAAEINRLRQVMNAAGLLAAYADNQNQRDKVIALMVAALPSRLPDNPRVAIVNNSRNEREAADSVINGITEGFLSKNITVINRSHRALVEMERDYQLSGNVSDEEMIRIGNEAGANTFILAAVTGSGAVRRLSVRMIDIERNTVLYQSPQSDEMNL